MRVYVRLCVCVIVCVSVCDREFARVHVCVIVLGRVRLLVCV